VLGQTVSHSRIKPPKPLRATDYLYTESGSGMITVMVAITIMVSIAAVTVVTIPVAIFVPATFATIPPSVELIPTTLARGVQLPAFFICLAATLAVSADRVVVFGLYPFNSTMALCPVVPVGTRTRSPGVQQERTQHCGRDRRFPES
jgi:hypothetical protein